MKRTAGVVFIFLLFGLIVNPALATKDAVQGASAGVRTYEVEIYGVPAKVSIAEAR